jgi:hypothetical protein
MSISFTRIKEQVVSHRITLAYTMCDPVMKKKKKKKKRTTSRAICSREEKRKSREKEKNLKPLS